MINCSLSAYPSIYSCYLNLQRMVRTNQHKLIVYQKLKKILLFDLENDPEGKRDLSDVPTYQNVKKKMRAMLVQQQNILNDPLGTFDFSKFQSTID